MINSIVDYLAGHPIAHGMLIGVLVRHALGGLFQRKVSKDKTCNGKGRIKYLP